PEPAKTILSVMGAPLGLVDLHGEIDVRLFAYIEALFGAWRKEFNLVSPFKLLDFTVSIPEPPVLAEGHTVNNTQDNKNTIADGVLRLNVGPYANNRVNGAATDGDESVFLKKTGGSPGDETIAVWGDALGVSEADAQQFDHVKQIIIDTGTGNDHVTFKNSGGYIMADALIMGGPGNDTLDLTGLGGHATVHGGPGNDTIIGGGDPSSPVGEWLYGDDGSDTVKGGPGPDTIIAGAGDDSVD